MSTHRVPHWCQHRAPTWWRAVLQRISQPEVDSVLSASDDWCGLFHAATISQVGRLSNVPGQHWRWRLVDQLWQRVVLMIRNMTIGIKPAIVPTLSWELADLCQCMHSILPNMIHMIPSLWWYWQYDCYGNHSGHGKTNNPTGRTQNFWGNLAGRGRWITMDMVWKHEKTTNT